MHRCTMCKHEKSDEHFEKPDGGLYKTCNTCREYGREYSKWYSETYPEKRKASRKRFKLSPKGKATEKKYRQGKCGKASRKRAKAKYRASEKGKAAERAYRNHQSQEYRNRHKDKIAARSAISNALRDNKHFKRPLHCEICDQVAKLHAHHYAGWEKQHHFSVWWLCNRCDPSFDSLLPHDGSITLEQAKELVIPTPAD